MRAGRKTLAAARRSTSSPGAVALLVTAIALLPVIAVVVTRSGRTWVPAQDLALIDLRVRDVWSHNAPLIGPYSRFGWSHPGPVLFYALAIPSALAGRSAWATLVGGALLQGIAICALARHAWRRGGLALLSAAMVLLALSYVQFGALMLLQPWNPRIAFPFFALFVFQAWAIAEGDLRQAPWAVLVASLLVQTHVGYLPFVGALAIWAAIRGLRSDHRSTVPPRRLVIAMGVVVAAIWAPVVANELLPGRANVRPMVQYFTSAHGAVAGLHNAAGFLAAEFRFPFPWLGGKELVNPVTHIAEPASLLWLVAPVLLFSLAVITSWRSADVRSRRALELAALLLVVAVASISRIGGGLSAYLFYWRVFVALFFLGVTFATLARRVGLFEHRGGAKALQVALLVALLLSAGSVARDVWAEREAVRPYETTVAETMQQLRARGLPRKVVSIKPVGSGLGGSYLGLINELDRSGVPVRVDPSISYQFGFTRKARSQDVSAVWLVLESGYLIERISKLPGTRVLATTTPLSSTDEARLRLLEDEVTSQLEAAGRPDLLGSLDTALVGFATNSVAGVDHVAVDRIAQMNSKVAAGREARTAVVAVAPRDLREVLAAAHAVSTEDR